MLLTGFVTGCEPQTSVPGTANLGKERVVVSERWDTIFQVGTPDVNDTVFGAPDEMILWGSRVAVGDRISMRILAISRSGDLLWTFGREGHGPGEFAYIAGMEVAGNGNLWVLDNRNARITEISPEGELVRVILQRQLPFPPTNMLRLADRVLFIRNRPDSAFTFADAKFRVLGSRSIPWPGELSDDTNLRQVVAAVIPDRTAWVSAFALGPGFMVWRAGSVGMHHYIEPIPFALKVSNRVRAMGADSARFGAVSISAVDDELYMLFGGRPFRRLHAMEPTVWIDVYGITGEYRHSYRLPMDADGMATDGHTFYILQTELYPSLIALRPRRAVRRP